MRGKSKQDLILEAVTDLEARIRTLENELAASRKALKIVLTIVNIFAGIAAIVFGALKIFGIGRGKRGRVRGKSGSKK